MISLVRGFTALVVGVATAYFAGFILAGILSMFLPDGLTSILGFGASLWLAWLAGRRVWRATGETFEGAEDGGYAVLRGAVTGALIVGAIGFVLGFFGPIILTPEANQGPLLGLFITGPLGVALGAVAGAARARRKQ